MNHFLGSLALLPIEKILNAVVDRDPYISQQFTRFDLKCIEVNCINPKFSLSVRFENRTIKLSAIDSQTLGIEVDASIRGKAETLLGLLLKNSETGALADAGIEIAGDATLIQELQMTIESLDIDWQDYLAPLLGDVISHQLGKIDRHTRDWGRSASSNMQRSIRDYLSEEARLIPSAMEVDSFSDRLDQLRLSIDRAAAKSELLERRLSLFSDRK